MSQEEELMFVEREINMSCDYQHNMYEYNEEDMEQDL